MHRKLISIAFAFQIIWFSIGVQVMQHHCIWCGGDRIEVVSHNPHDTDEHSCCSDQEDSHHDCAHDGCCQPELVKLTTGINLEDGSELSADVRSIGYDLAFTTVSLHLKVELKLTNDFHDRRGSPLISPPTAFLVPMRC